MARVLRVLAILSILTLAIIPGLVSAAQWNYTTPGIQYWLCPANITRVSLSIAGGGGSGASSSMHSGFLVSGLGGAAGGYGNYTMVTVVPDTNYSITVGAGGAQADPPEKADNTFPNKNPGSASTAFGISKSGGAGGNIGCGYSGFQYCNGGDGVGTSFMNLSRASSGGDSSPYTGGVGGVGYGSGGGGAAGNGTGHDYWYVGSTYGGAGKAGYIQITTANTSVGNWADFSATPRTGSGGTLISFTNLSIIHDTVNLTYLWDFGDGGTSNTTGNVNHVYSYTGIYTVSLTVTSDEGAATETKTDYIIISATDYFDPNTPPKSVRFHIQTLWGMPLPGATVSALGITTSTGSWDWVVTLLGIPLDEVGINGTAMTDTTDSNGNIEFLMVPSAKYNVTTTLTGYSFPIFYVTPHDSQYNIVAALNGTGWFETGNDTLEQVNISVTSNKISDTIGQINISYYDAGGTTVGGTVNITQDNSTRGGADVLVVSIPITSSSFNESRNVTIPQEGIGYKVAVDANPYGTAGPDIKAIRSFAVWFKGSPVLLAGFSPTILLWFSIFLLIFTAMFAGATHAPQMAIVICVEAWVLFSMGWLDPLEQNYWVGQPVLIFTLGFATVMAIFWNFREGKRKEKGT
jgi:PKD repeat protein